MGSCYSIFKISVNRRKRSVASITRLFKELNEYCLIGLHLHWKDAVVKFPHSPILHYAFSSWTEKTMTKTIDCHWENRFVLQ